MIRQAVVLAAGKGVRLKPITETVPKVMVRIGDKPIVEYIIEKLRKLSVNDIALVVNYKGDKVREHFKDSVKYFKQEKTLGTANAVYAAKDFVKDDKFLAIYGDVFFADDLSDFVKQEPTLMAVHRVEDRSAFGRIEVKNDRVVDVVEKDGIKKPGLVNAGIYLFDRKIFDAIERTELSPRGEYELTDSIKILIEDGVVVRPYLLKGVYWRDIGRISDLEDAQKFIG